MLKEGDRVTFGHPMGVRLPAGKRARQPDSEHQFIVSRHSFHGTLLLFEIF